MVAPLIWNGFLFLANQVNLVAEYLHFRKVAFLVRRKVVWFWEIHRKQCHHIFQWMSNLNCTFLCRFAAFIHSVGDSPQYHIRSLIFWGNLECLPWAQKHKRNSDERFYRSDCGTNLGVAISCFATNLKIINNEPTRCLSSDLDQPVQALLYSAIGSTMLPELPMLQVLTNCHFSIHFTASP